jgi:polysaccharide biosynthesis transport protein
MKLALPNANREFRKACANPIPRRELGVSSLQWTSEPPPTSDLHFEPLAGILHRRIGLVLAVAALGTLLTGTIALLIPPKYTAKAQIIVDPERASVVIGEAPIVPPADVPAIATRVTMLTSRVFLQRVRDNLSQDPEFRASASNTGTETAPRASNTSKVDISSRSAAAGKPAGPIATKGGTFRLADLERYLKVGQERSSRIIGVSFTSTSAKRAAIVVNRVAQLYVESQRQQARGNASRELAQLDERIGELKVEAERARTAVQVSIQQGSGQTGAGDGDEREAEIQLRELEHEAAGRDQLYDNLLGRQKEIRYRQEIVEPDVRIVSLAAPPTQPSSWSASLLIIPASVVFLISGCFLARFIERLDRGVRSEQQIRDALGLPCLGLVPQLSRTGRYRPHKYVMRHPFAAYTEAIRSVVVALQLTGPPQASKIILISSSAPREGKTTLAVSLAVYLALLRRRVVLVDLDFRRPMILRTLRARAKKGVLDVLLHDLPPAEATQHIPNLSLDYLPMSHCPVDPITLFAGGQVSRLLHRLRERYDCVIIDSQPLIGTTEAQLLAKLADKLLFVVKWDSTKQEVAQNAVKLLHKAGCLENECNAHPVAVVTQVNLKEHARYRYGDVGEYFAKYNRHYSRFTGYRSATNV